MNDEKPGFDATQILESVRQDRDERRHRRTWGKSKLARHRAELVKLKNAGASLGDLAHWLKTAKRLTVNRSTIARYLAKLPELQSGPKPDAELP